MSTARLTAAVLGLLFAPGTASAHYLWLAVDPKAGEHGKADVYFEEGPRPGDGEYLDPFVKRGKAWIRTPDREKPTALKLSEVKKPGKRWLSADLPASGPRSIDSHGKFGVYRYGNTPVLLHYYARYLDVGSAAQLRRLARAKHLALDIVARWEDGELRAQVLWKGKPAAGRPVRVRGPDMKANVKTDDRGLFRFRPKGPGRYMLHTSFDEPDRKGTDDGKEYELTRHHSTLTIELPLRSSDSSASPPREEP